MVAGSGAASANATCALQVEHASVKYCPNPASVAICVAITIGYAVALGVVVRKYLRPNNWAVMRFDEARLSDFTTSNIRAVGSQTLVVWRGAAVLFVSSTCLMSFVYTFQSSAHFSIGIEPVATVTLVLAGVAQAHMKL